MGFFTINRQSKYDPPSLLEQALTSPLVLLVSFIHTILLAFRGSPLKPPENKPPIKVVCISDTHSKTPPVPSGDLLIHAGDLTNSGSKADIQKQLDWLNTLPHRHKVIVAGNHDNYLDPASQARVQERQSSNRTTYAGKLNFGSVIYLHGTSTVLKFKGGRELRVFGAADLPRLGGDEHAFQYEHADAEKVWMGRVPGGTDVLITHTPPAAHRDLRLGCPALLREIWRLKPKLHVFGHIHSGHGREAVFFDPAQEAMERLRSGQNGLWRDFTDVGRWVDATRVVWGGVRGILWHWLMNGGRTGPGRQGGLIVNAALTYQSTSRIGNQAQIVEL